MMVIVFSSNKTQRFRSKRPDFDFQFEESSHSFQRSNRNCPKISMGEERGGGRKSTGKSNKVKRKRKINKTKKNKRKGKKSPDPPTCSKASHSRYVWFSEINAKTQRRAPFSPLKDADRFQQRRQRAAGIPRVQKLRWRTAIHSGACARTLRKRTSTPPLLSRPCPPLSDSLSRF